MSINNSQLKAVLRWLADARYVWLTAAVIGVAIDISLFKHPTEPFIRITGLVLQVIGISTVIWGISNTRALFGQPSFASKTKAWLSRFPLLYRDYTKISATLSNPVGTIKGIIYIKNELGTDPTIEARLDALEKNVTSIHELIYLTKDVMEEEIIKITNSLKQEQQSRQAEDNTIREKLEATGTGGVHISAIGASLLFLGVILSTASTEIAALLK